MWKSHATQTTKLVREAKLVGIRMPYLWTGFGILEFFFFFFETMIQILASLLLHSANLGRQEKVRPLLHSLLKKRTSIQRE